MWNRGGVLWSLLSRRSAFGLEATFLSGFCLGVNHPVHVHATDFDLCHAVAPFSPSLLVIRASVQIMTLITEQQCNSVRGFIFFRLDSRCCHQSVVTHKKKGKTPHWDHPRIMPGYSQSFESRKLCGTIAYSTKRHNLVLHQFEEDVTEAGPHKLYEQPRLNSPLCWYKSSLLCFFLSGKIFYCISHHSSCPWNNRLELSRLI